jgi:hypothetical protein
MNDEQRRRRAARLRQESLRILAEQPNFIDRETLDRMAAREEHRARDNAPLPAPIAKPAPAKQDEVLYRSINAPVADVSASWHSYFEAMLEQERIAVAQVTGEYIAEEIDKLRREITKKIDAEIASLRSETRVGTAEAKSEVLGTMTGILSELRRGLFDERKVIDAQPTTRSRAVN